MRILLMSNQIPMPNEQRVMRINTLYSMLVEKGHKVTVLTSLFNHYDKKKRNKTATFNDFNVVFVNEPGYKQNISIKRVFSQIVFGKNVKKWFKKHYKDFDVVFAVVPTYECSYHVGKICKKNSIPFILDVEDLWPEGMKVFFKNSFLYNLLFPIRILSNKTYKLADSITAVSNNYLSRSLEKNKKAINNSVVYLGVDSNLFNSSLKEEIDVKKEINDFWVCYIGTLGFNYDIETLIFAMGKLKEEGYDNIKLKILGKGPKEDEFKKIANSINANIEFIAFMGYQKMVKYISNCDLMINPIKKEASASVINKVGDYFACGKPVLNSCSHVEMKELIDKYDVGFNYEAKNVDQLKDLIIREYSDEKIRNIQGKNSLDLFKEKFDRRKTYLTLINQIEISKSIK